MDLNEWWRDIPRERYWMEITDRADLGADLHAPQLDDGGRENWSYALVTAVRPGDIVLHWHKRLGSSPGIVGHSIAVGRPFVDQIVWTAHGTYGRTRPSTLPEPSWKRSLTDFTPLIDPVGQSVFRRIEPALRTIKENLESRHKGGLYFPFAFSDKRPVRVAQGYMVKFPAAIVAEVGVLRSLPNPVPDTPADRRPPGSSTGQARKHANTGRLADKPLQLAIERHAVDWAMDMYGVLGYSVRDVGATESYDVLAVSASEEIHIEVKGSLSRLTAVELTRNEVNHGQTDRTDLVVVDEIRWARRPDGSIETSGGRARRWQDWSPMELHLEPTRYRYQLPSDEEQYDVSR